MKKTLLFDWKNEIKQEELEQVIHILDHDGIIIFPTDTVYGIGGSCFHEDVIQQLYELKKRSYRNPINVLTNSFEKVKLVSDSIGKEEEKLIKKYMPGALTVILSKKNTVPDLLTSNLDTIGVRIPNHEIALRILEAVDYPLATSSANISTFDAGICVNDFIDEFNGKVDAIIDGGISPIKHASTVVQVCGKEIKILRQGSVEVNL